jgi:fluoride exporter
MSGAAIWGSVALLGGAGAVARFAVDSMIERRANTEFPLGTFVINMTGTFLLALLTAATIGSTTLFLVGTGLLGSYTTYSTWIFEAEQLVSDGEYVLAAANLTASALAGIGIALAGWEIGIRL